MLDEWIETLWDEMSHIVGLLGTNNANWSLGFTRLHKMSYGLGLDRFHRHRFDKDGSNSGPYTQVDVGNTERIKVSLAVGWNRWWLTHAWLFTLCFMMDGHLMWPCRHDMSSAVYRLLSYCLPCLVCTQMNSWMIDVVWKHIYLYLRGFIWQGWAPIW